MLTELNGKGGKLCQAALDGRIKCPLMIRPTSEDVLTGQLFQSLRAIDPRWWLPGWLNRALGFPRFRQQWFRGYQVTLWENRPRMPRDLLPWPEGSTQVDVTVRWENPPTTVFIEMKYRSRLSSQTTHQPPHADFPTDQLIRNIRVGLWETGYLRPQELFQRERRDFVILVLAPQKQDPLVEKYRHPAKVLDALPNRQHLRDLPRAPWLGEGSFQDLRNELRLNRRFASRPERQLMDDIVDYLAFKLQSSHNVTDDSAASHEWLESDIA